MGDRFADVLHTLVRDPRWCKGTLQEALQALTEAASDALGAGRVSVWTLDPEATRIRCANLYDAAVAKHTSGAVLAVEDCPPYFEAIADARVVAVADAVHDPRTRGLAAPYLAPLRIASLLDAPVLIDGELSGVVCHEALGAQRAWTEEEQAFAGSIGDLAALAYQAARRREAEDALRRREREVNEALRAAGTADWRWDIRADTVTWSDGVGPIFGREEGWQPPDLAAYLDLVHEDDREPLQAAIDEAMRLGGDYYVEHRLSSPEGPERWIEGRGHVFFDEDGAPSLLTGVVRDHTRRRELEGRLARADRLESLGRLAGGVAHDFNNLLTAILGSCELLKHERVTASQQEVVSMIDTAASRAADLTQQLLAFSKRMPQTPKPLNLATAVHASADLLRRLLGEDIEVTIEAPEEAWVVADPAQIEQVIMNLAVNARDAMPRGGQLTFAVCTLPPPEDGVELTVTDTGGGIPPEVMDRIFEPFFTTKTDHLGTGLGLATCHGIVSQYGGEISVESADGYGTTFRIALPRSREQGSEDAESPPHHHPTRRREHVLVVEDAPEVAAIVLEVLKRDGHEVTHFVSGDDAIAWLDRGNRPTALISDVVLEGARGPEVALHARRACGPLPTLLVSGYAQVSLPPGLEGIDVLSKPFRPTQIRGWLSDLAERSRGRLQAE